MASGIVLSRAVLLALTFSSGAAAQGQGSVGGYFGYARGSGPSADRLGGGMVASIESRTSQQSAWSFRLSGTYLDLSGEPYGSDVASPPAERYPDLQGFGLALGAQIGTRDQPIRTYALIEAGPYWLKLEDEVRETTIGTLGLALGAGIEALRGRVTPYLEGKYQVLATDRIAPEGRAGRLLSIAAGARIHIARF